MKATITKTPATIEELAEIFEEAATNGLIHFESAIRPNGSYHVSITTDDETAEAKKAPKKKAPKKK